MQDTHQYVGQDPAEIQKREEETDGKGLALDGCGGKSEAKVEEFVLDTFSFQGRQSKMSVKRKLKKFSPCNFSFSWMQSHIL